MEVTPRVDMGLELITTAPPTDLTPRADTDLACLMEVTPRVDMGLELITTTPMTTVLVLTPRADTDLA